MRELLEAQMYAVRYVSIRPAPGRPDVAALTIQTTHGSLTITLHAQPAAGPVPIYDYRDAHPRTQKHKRPATHNAR